MDELCVLLAESGVKVHRAIVAFSHCPKGMSLVESDGNRNAKNIAICIDYAPEPEIPPTDRDDILIHVQRKPVIGSYCISGNLPRKAEAFLPGN